MTSTCGIATFLEVTASQASPSQHLQKPPFCHLPWRGLLPTESRCPQKLPLHRLIHDSFSRSCRSVALHREDFCRRSHNLPKSCPSIGLSAGSISSSRHSVWEVETTSLD